MTQQMSDDELVRQVLAGRPEAEAALVARHRRYAYRLCRRMLGDHHQAEDASQEAFMRAFGGLEGFRGQVPFRRWFTRILVNVCLNWQRAAKRRPDVARVKHEPGVDPAGSGVELTELQTVVQAAIQRLPEKQRMTLILRVYEGLGFAEIAELLGSGPQAARANLSLARKKLRESLSPYFDEV